MSNALRPKGSTRTFLSLVFHNLPHTNLSRAISTYATVLMTLLVLASATCARDDNGFRRLGAPAGSAAKPLKDTA